MRHFKVLSLFYFLVLAIEIYAEVMDDRQLVWFTKPILMPLLLVLFLLNAQQNQNKERIYFSLALIFSLAGDVFLMFKNDDLFVFGLGSFLIGHLAYILSFSGRIKDAKVPLLKKLLLALPFLVFVVSFLLFLHPYITSNPETQPIFIPVMVYASVIGTMGYTALLRKNGTTASSFILVFVGALLFVLSDSCIAINKFVNPLPQSGLIIMLTYGVAQYLMTLGTLKGNPKA